MSNEIERLETTVAKLDISVHTLDLTVGTLTVTLNTLSARAAEDRMALAKASAETEARLGAVERWRSRIVGQIGLLGFIVGIIVMLVAGKALHIY